MQACIQWRAKGTVSDTQARVVSQPEQTVATNVPGKIVVGYGFLNTALLSASIYVLLVDARAQGRGGLKEVVGTRTLWA